MGSPVFLIAITITFTILHLSSSTSSVLVFPLTHSLSNSRYSTPSHLLKSTSTNSAARFRRHRQVSLPLNPGSDYTLSFTLGSQTISLYMDTGSDVVWLPCHPFECMLCEGKYNPAAIPNAGPLNLTSAKPVTCKSPACSAVHSSLPSSDLCAIANCPLDELETSDCRKFSCPAFYYAYGDGSLIAKLYQDNLSLSLSSPDFVLKDFTFGCAHTALGEPIGVAGFGRGALSMPAQLARSSPEIGNYFSYCLVSHSFDDNRVRIQSPLILGRYKSAGENKEKQSGENQIGGDGYVYTPMLKNKKHPYFYYVGLDGVSVGRKRIPAPESLQRIDGKGNGGMVVDSGTTYTMLPPEFYNSVVTEFGKRVGSVYKRAGEVEDRTGLGPCYYMTGGGDKAAAGVVPPLLWHFAGNSSVVMPRRNYFYEFLDGGDDGKVKRKVGCLMLMNGGDVGESSGPAGLLGNYQQQGFEVVYDLEKGRVGFARRKCASLWKNLN
ncbi:OLC1v1031846C1 [Oldenlandia corymbosa var. corymbosa]|uniref:OLC1v1031846C1 n=1 Tax=Oldenlandia corymbosa var. corymbosa TaxID=529605 RepID=A0AAV1CJD4_OLDCO|nr:OLC1v1031846C1 [Oldenlandia corymbosa var. corymbosa]